MVVRSLNNNDGQDGEDHHHIRALQALRHVPPGRASDDAHEQDQQVGVDPRGPRCRERQRDG